MRESRTYGSVRGAHSDVRPYRDRFAAHALAYVDGPLLAGAVESVMRIACVHMCGFSARMDAAELAFATRVPNNDAAWTAVARSGVSRVLDRSITIFTFMQVPASGAGGLVPRQTRIRQTSVSLFGREPFLRPGHHEEGAPRAEAVKERGA